ncbi:MAG: murein hydrolase activator EnvC family protein [Armatimonadota bacterium]
MIVRRGNLLAGIMAAAATCALAWGQTAKQLERQREENAAKKRTVRRKLRITKSEQRRLLAQVRASEARLRSARAQLRKSQAQLEKTRAKLRDIRARHAQTNQELEEAEEAFGARLKVLCKRGHGSYLAVILGAQDFAEFSRRAFIAQRILDYDAALLEAIKAKQKELAEQQAQLEAQEREEAQERTEVARRASIVEQKARRLRADKATVDEQRRILEAQLDQLERDHRRITAMLRELQRGGVVYKGPPQWTGDYHFPVPGGKVGSGFGMRMHPILRRRRMHYGVDIGARTGTPIEAAETGRVVFAGRQGGYGNVVILDHGGGVQTLYAHCSSLAARKGQTVRRGQLIGRVGSTGLTTGPHLHFELLIRGRPVNPLR